MITGITQSGAEPYKLWINDKWYIPIDQKGRVPAGLCAEGALGIVIQLQSDVDNEQHKALKIPRLMGETPRENAYINELAEKELKAVEEIFNKKGGNDGLLKADTVNGSQLRGPIYIQKGSENAKKWNEALIFVSFKKGQNPTFCLVKFDDKLPTQYYPPESDCPFRDEKVAFREKIETKAKVGSRSWERTVFIEGGEAQDAGQRNHPNILSVDEALKETDVGGRTWYTCLPSVIYDWAPVNLQESISLNYRNGPWDKGKHFALMEQVCRGLVTLHGRKMLHADVRPANMVHEGDADDPHNYYLSDYGSFSDPGARAGDRNPEGNTVLGPVVSGERISAFYAPERRHSQERESANVAIINNSTPDDLYIILGWSSELLDPLTNKPMDNLKEFVNPDYLRKHKNEYPNKLVKGDRIQIREYIFDVEEEWHIKNKQILKCKSRFWKIYHGRIVVENDESFHDWDSFPIPRTVELRQWSAATDLYSLGAMALYSVFCDSVHKQRDKSVENKTSKDYSKMEDEFREMLLYLESKSYFNAIWPELEWMRSQIESHLAKKGLTEEMLANQDFEGYTAHILREKKEKKLKGAVVALVGRITQSVPGARKVVEALDYDLGTFIFFIHFVICCLQRQSEVEVPDLWKEIESIKPFAIDRLEEPMRNGAAAKALERIGRLKQLIGDRLLDGLRLEPSKKDSSSDSLNDKKDLTTEDIPPFDPRPTSAIRAELDQSREKLDDAEEKLDDVEKKLDETRDDLNLAKTAVDDGLKITKSIWAFLKNNELKEILQKAQKAIDADTQS